jgi:hypothetical protein
MYLLYARKLPWSGFISLDLDPGNRKLLTQKDNLKNEEISSFFSWIFSMEALTRSLKFFPEATYQQKLFSSNCSNFSVSSHQIPGFCPDPESPESLDPEPDSLKKQCCGSGMLIPDPGSKISNKREG